jgi:hypothetical protein
VFLLLKVILESDFIFLMDVVHAVFGLLEDHLAMRLLTSMTAEMRRMLSVN